MAKISVRTSLTNNNEINKKEVSGMKKENKIIYKDNNILVTIFIYDNKIVMNRHTEEYDLSLEFVENKVTKNIYKIHNIGDIELDVNTLLLEIKEQYIKIKYSLNDDLFIFVLEYD